MNDKAVFFFCSKGVVFKHLGVVNQWNVELVDILALNIHYFYVPTR